MNEIWKRVNEIKEYEDVVDYIEVSNFGNVVARAHQSSDGKTIKEKSVNKSFTETGYKISVRKKDGKSTTCILMYIIAKLFVENPNNYLSVVCIDGNMENINSSNLIWDTPSNPIYDKIKNLEGEIWKPIEAAPIYMISNKGRIKSIARDHRTSKTSNIYNIKEAFLLTPTLEERSGYLAVGLSINNKIKTFRVHRLVAETFLPNPENKSQVDHINQNKVDNSLDNLRWVSPKENSSNGGTSAVIVTFPDLHTETFDSITEAAEITGYSCGSITTHCSRRSKQKQGGFGFRWVEQKKKLGAQNKRKGNGFELQVIHRLNDMGFNTVSSRSESKRTDDNKIDIYDLDGTLPVNIQTKYTSTTPNYFNIENQCTDKSKPFTIIWKKSVSGENSPGTIAMIPASFFYDILKILKDCGKLDSLS